MNPEELTIKELKELTKDPNTSGQDLHKIYRAFKDWTIFADIAENPNVTSATLQLIAGDEDCFIRAVVAESPNCTQDLLQRLSTDSTPMVRHRVWKNPNATEEIQLTVKAMWWMEDLLVGHQAGRLALWNPG